MVTVKAIIRSGHSLLTLLPTLLWVPVDARLQLRRATSIFENELLVNGLEPLVAHELANAFHETFKQVIREVTSPQNWAQMRDSM